MMGFLLRRMAMLCPVLLLAGSAAAATEVPGPGPQELIETAATRMLNALDADRVAARS